VRLIFFGTPEFAVPSLEALLGEGFDVLAVVTQPDRPQGRSRSQVVPSPVKIAAEAEDLPVLQPERPNERAFVEQLRALAPPPDIGVVVAYGHILKPELLAIPGRGMINVHASLLPELRGPAPVQWAIINGFATTGVTIMQMDAGMDTGPILHRLPHHIDPEVTGGELAEHLAEMGAQALVETLTLLEQDELTAQPQDDARATYAPKLTREAARIRWTDPADTVARLIRALDPKPAAWTELDGQEIKLFGAGPRPHPPADRGGAAGEVVTADTRLLIGTGAGTVEVEEVQPAGKSRMTVADWVRGRGVKAGQRFV
jgi:methionyl-tRNA formyltransferase